MGTEMAWEGKTVAIKPDNLRLIPGTNMLERNASICCPLTSTLVSWHAHACFQPHKYTKEVIKFETYF